MITFKAKYVAWIESVQKENVANLSRNFFNFLCRKCFYHLKISIFIQNNVKMMLNTEMK